MIPSMGKCKAENELTANKGKVPVILNIEISHQPSVYYMHVYYIWSNVQK